MILEVIFSPVALHQGGRHHGEGGDEEAGPDAVERGYAGRVAGEATGKGDENGVVKWDQEEEEEVRDGLEGGWGYG